MYERVLNVLCSKCLEVIVHVFAVIRLSNVVFFCLPNNKSL